MLRSVLAVRFICSSAALLAVSGCATAPNLSSIPLIGEVQSRLQPLFGEKSQQVTRAEDDVSSLMLTYTDQLGTLFGEGLIGTVSVFKSQVAKGRTLIVLHGPKNAGGQVTRTVKLGFVGPGERMEVFLPPGDYSLVAGDSSSKGGKSIDFKIAGGSTHGIDVQNTGDVPIEHSKIWFAPKQIAKGSPFSLVDLNGLVEEYQATVSPEFTVNKINLTQEAVTLRFNFRYPKGVAGLTVNGESYPVEQLGKDYEVIRKVEPGDNRFSIVVRGKGGREKSAVESIRIPTVAEIKAQERAAAEAALQYSVSTSVITPRTLAVEFAFPNPEVVEGIVINGTQYTAKQFGREHKITRNVRPGENKLSIVVRGRGGVEKGKTEVVLVPTAAEMTAARKEQERIAAENARLEQLRRQMEIDEVARRRAEQERLASQGDGSADDLLCKKYGFTPATEAYAQCRFKIDFAKQESKRQAEQYERERLEYERRLAAIERENERRKALNQIELGFRLLGGQNPVDAVNSVGTGAPIAPRPPAPVFHNITLPNGNLVTCTTNGAFTNCN